MYMSFIPGNELCHDFSAIMRRPGKDKILIVSKDLDGKGGVANYYRLFFECFTQQMRLRHFAVGTRAEDYYKKKSAFRYIIAFLADMVNFIRLLKKNKEIRIVQLNPSLIPVPILRDGLLLIAAKLMGRRVVLFFRGWDLTFARKVNSRPLFQKVLAWLCRRSDQVLVLARRFKRELVAWGAPEGKIEVSSTMFDGKLVSRSNGCKPDRLHFLFLGRISKQKGVFEIIEAASALRLSGLDFRLTIVGFGKDEQVVDRLKQHAETLQLDDLVTFKGYLEGKEKYDQLADADVFLLPSYSEGGPNSVLEAMASGLFVICTGVGALQEVVQDGVNGLIVRPKDARDLAEKMRYAVEHPDEVRRNGRESKGYAFDNFEAGIIVERFEKMYTAMMET